MPADKNKMELYKIIERKEKIPVGYRMIQCDSAPVPQTSSFTWRLAVKSSPEVPRFIMAFKLINLTTKGKIQLYLIMWVLKIFMLR